MQHRSLSLSKGGADLSTPVPRPGGFELVLRDESG
ncbi:hypothetical protein PLANTIT3_60169 [Plantibacter sp. T3]|nr:hypothetical protein PLANTIT3_60169 [Plantibacter sp. T3]